MYILSDADAARFSRGGPSNVQEEAISVVVLYKFIMLCIHIYIYICIYCSYVLVHQTHIYTQLHH